MIDFIKKVNYPLVLIIAYIVKLCIIAPTFPDAIVLAVLGAVYGIRGYYITKDNLITENLFRDQVNRDIQLIQSHVSGINLKMGGGGDALQGHLRRR